ncbi:demethylmenaquinone methyltransferase [Staphylococcus intermedius]|uniref:Demethylmenaquinone methyltransferase n=1 Tax=Staphylococcus intermedius NCTC 11048 TaxID=1141106 RepID=A0A380G6N9_STAIN|nr:demethylmenaquinone methyltransferase [Staphylococcus intermedius]PCF64885.1 bifunctional demethylmenaquinone methyltransferase/2-methoxy-6-polyprenyl-1,4-benzoquinol methylase [Staphylococcus intermedius]PCF80495.1 bifunctional demethylmenaquinone methyltransferase/2-methoxy-6-polyprenyl-1,4-benzoquinol methylase [Staphylococcus intermedius]PCF81845.1 bifunctional demethylmenaquinone methyltransferase/2-methoxy-6-polyprenyl-1,4-benzoquinol methylase [Staphylococcus intermedius]PCF88182.1 bi
MTKNKANKAQVHEVFQNISGKYDRLNNIISFEQHKVWRKKVMKEMDVQPGKIALDVCCGTADWTIALSQSVGPEGEVTGLDFSENMLKVGEEKTAHMDNIRLVQGDAMALPFDDNSFDYVTIGFGLRNIPDYTQALSEMYRVLKPGGMAVCLETSQPTMPVFKQGYRLYFKFVMPIFGKIFAKSKQEYEWLQQSAFDFPDRETLKQMFESVNFENVKVRSFTGGVAAMHLAYKPKTN